MWLATRAPPLCSALPRVATLAPPSEGRPLPAKSGQRCGGLMCRRDLEAAATTGGHGWWNAPARTSQSRGGAPRRHGARWPCYRVPSCAEGTRQDATAAPVATHERAGAMRQISSSTQAASHGMHGDICSRTTERVHACASVRVWVCGGGWGGVEGEGAVRAKGSCPTGTTLRSRPSLLAGATRKRTYCKPAG